MWLDPLPEEAELQAFYVAAYFAGGGQGRYLDYMADEAQHRSNALSRVELAGRFGAKPPGAWLDIGCAAGFTLDEARKKGFSVFGVELSDWASTVARSRFGLQVFSTLADARKTLTGRIDILTLFQVFEHMRDPMASLEDARACLRPGGLLVIETWDRGSTIARLAGQHWQQISPPSVLWLFDRASLSYALKRAGFRVHTIQTSSKMISVGWALGLIADSLPRFSRPFVKALAVSRLGKIAFRYGLGDLVTVVAVSDGAMKHAE